MGTAGVKRPPMGRGSLAALPRIAYGAGQRALPAALMGTAVPISERSDAPHERCALQGAAPDRAAFHATRSHKRRRGREAPAPERPVASMMPPLVTILSPTFNQERYVSQCIESALAQTYPHWEQIFVDDGSTDATREVIASYRDPRIRLIALPHRGLGALAESYNEALAVARGSLVGILEGDDAWPADKLA